MKRFLTLIFSILTIMIFTACGETNSSDRPANKTESAQSQPVEQKSDSVPVQSGSKILVAYFSRAGDNYDVGYIEKGNTHIMADMIAEVTKADEFEIKTVNPYPADYRECTEVAQRELSEDARPAIDGKIENFEQYDTIFLGYPIWWSDMPMVIYTFLESYDFNGKTIIPFCTSAGEAMTGKEVNIPKIAKGSQIRQGLGVSGKRCQENPDSVRQDVNSWLKDLGF